MLRYEEYLKEAKSSKKEEIKKALLKLFRTTPLVKAMSPDKFEDQKSIYSLAGVQKYMKDKYDNKYTKIQIDSAFSELKEDKDFKFSSVRVKNFFFNDYFPHWYLDEKVSKTEARDVKKRMEMDNKLRAKDVISKRKDVRDNTARNTKPARKKRMVK